jgi:hypothetical protein
MKLVTGYPKECTLENILSFFPIHPEDKAKEAENQQRDLFRNFVFIYRIKEKRSV